MPTHNGPEQETDLRKLAESAGETLLQLFNPTGEALAAEYWLSKKKKRPDGSPESGFSPVCRNKFKHDVGCELGRGGRCRDCNKKQLLPLDAEMIARHIIGKKSKDQAGIYPMLPGDATAWVAADLDNHDGRKDPAEDVRKLIHVSNALDVPIIVFNSNSGKGYHIYIFFEKPIPAVKARALLLALLDRAGVDISHRRDKEGSFDCVFPKQDRLL